MVQSSVPPQPSYLYETDPKSGLPRLRRGSGPALGWTNREVEQLEEQLQTRYHTLSIAGAGTLEFKGRMMHVRRQAGDMSRQATLELFLADPTAAPPVPLTTAGPDAAAPRSWFAGMEADFLALLASGRGKTVDEPEKAILGVVLNELRRLSESRPAGEVAAVFVGAVALLAERLKRGQQPGKAMHYTLALTGVEKILDAAPPLGPMPTAPTADPPPSWFARLWSGIRG